MIKLPRAGLFLKYFAIIGVLVTVEMAAMAAIGLWFSYQESQKALAQLQREKALTAAVQIEQFLTDIERQLGWTAMPIVAAGQDAVQARTLDYIKLQKQLQSVTETSYLDGEGKERLKISRVAMNTVDSGVDYSKDPRFVEARKGKTWFGPVYFRKETEPYMAISIPAARDRPGVTVVDVNLKFIWDVVNRIRVGSNGYAYVVDEKGYLIAHPNISLVLKKVDLSALPQVKQAITTPANSEQREVADARDIEGTPVFAAWAPVAATGWRVFVEEAQRDVFAPMYTAIQRTLYFMLAGIALSFLASWLLARRMVTPVRALQKGADRIGSGDLEGRIDVHTGDELEDLAARFNGMAEQLKESYAGLERKVEERTAELREALRQQTATAGILRAISSSTTDAGPVFEAIVTDAKRLVHADHVALALLDGQSVRRVAVTNDPAGPIAHPKTLPLSGRGGVAGRAILCGKTIEIPDVFEDPGFDHENFINDGCNHAIGIPLLREGTAIGALVGFWPTGMRVPPEHVRLLETFADQAVIAIENARLFHELEQRNQDLAETLSQQTATGEILRVISSSPTNVQPVFEAIVKAAKELGEASAANLVTYDGELLRRAAHTDPGLKNPEPWRPTRESVSGRVVMTRAVVEISDPHNDRELDHDRFGSRGSALPQHVIGVPMMREGATIGVLNVVWDGAGKAPEKYVRLLQTFADQAVIAIENVRLFHELQEKSRQLEIANKHKSEFLANMSHELRTPLNAIIGFSEVMINGMAGPMTDEQKEFAGDIRDSGKHLLTLINDILDLSKIEAGRMELDVAPFDVPGAMQNAMTLVQGRAARHGIHLETEIAPAVSEYQGDERKFKQIVINLLSNAVKFTPEGGKVTLAADRVNGAYSISVSDTGIGIAPEDQEKIFEEFKQVGSDYARKAEGTGLGLTLTRKLVELHGGRITVRSEPGRGSTFTFTLPIEA
jgi:signal transduction histidine kinase